LIPTELSPFGLRFKTPPKVNLNTLQEFKDGLFEIQDEGKQAACLQVKPRPGSKV
jgi:16S rRNA C967 or C1407 C5-methylase (RsmB/RsmF family)